MATPDQLLIVTLKARIDVMKSQLAAQGQETTPAPAEWMRKLTPSQRAIVGALYAAYPRAVRHLCLLESMTCRDHTKDRQMTTLTVQISHIRKKFGRNSIESQWGDGYRLGDLFYASIPKEPLAG